MAFTGCAGSSWRAPEHRLEVVPQSAWGGTPPDGSRGRLHRITRITLHHGGTPFTRDRDVAQHLRNLQAWSRRDRMWIDIPYHFVIDLEGRVYEARDLKFAGDTNTEYDPAGHALIVVLGDYEESEPTGAQLHALADTMAMLAWRFGLGVEAIGAHRDFSTRTACPGKNLYRVLQDGSLAAAVKARLAAWQAHTEARATQTRPDAQ
jgi:hypothetical protein